VLKIKIREQKLHKFKSDVEAAKNAKQDWGQGRRDLGPGDRSLVLGLAGSIAICDSRARGAGECETWRRHAACPHGPKDARPMGGSRC